MRTLVASSPDFWLGNLWWVVLLGVLALFALVYLLERFAVRPHTKKRGAEERSRWYAALGGQANLVDGHVEGSRLVLHVRDFRAIDGPSLKKAGATGYILKSDQLTLLVKGGANRLYQLLFP